MDLPSMVFLSVIPANMNLLSPDLIAVAEAPCLGPRMSVHAGGVLVARVLAWYPGMRQCRYRIAARLARLERE